MKNRIFVFSPILLWTVAISCSVAWNLSFLSKNTIQLVKDVGRSFFSKIETTRLWNAMHGGVYVVVTSRSQPNPYLQDPDRDISTSGGILLTKINPAYMTREISEIARRESHVQYHITSLKPIRHENAPDGWERSALEMFSRGTREILELAGETEIGDVSPFYRYMAPLEVKAPCLKCHNRQGYAVGDVIGGISVSIPAEKYLSSLSRSRREYMVLHTGLLLLGLFGLFIHTRYRSARNDLIAQRELVEEIANEYSEAAGKAKNEFLSNINHEFRTPLNAIIGFSQLLSNTVKLGDTEREHLNTIRRSGDKLLSLVNDLLDISKIEAGQLTLSPKNFDLIALLNEVEELFVSRARYRGVRLIFSHSDDMPHYIRTDEKRLKQVLINLVDSAVTCSEGGEIRVYTGLTGAPEFDMESSSDGSRISDNRSALSEAVIRFEIIYSGTEFIKEEKGHLLDDSNAGIVNGWSGEVVELGLSLSRRFVQLMGGELVVGKNSVKDIVIEFYIYVVVVTESHVEKRHHSRKIVGMAPGQPRYRILVVDDAEVNRRLMVHILSPLGFDLIEAENGEQAIELWEKFEPHIIWMDMCMPGMDGYEATRIIKSTPKGIITPVIALTSSIQEEQDIITFSAGCDDFLRKPYKVDEIFALMGRYLKLRYIYDNIRSVSGGAFDRSYPGGWSGRIQNGANVDSFSIVAEDFSEFAASFLNDFTDSLRRVNIDQINGFIKEIYLKDEKVADICNNMVNNYEYSKLICILEKATKQN